MYDELMQVDTGGNVKNVSLSSLVAFADDVAVITTRRTSHILETVKNIVLEKVADWMIRAELTL